MIEATIALISLFGLIALFLVKLYNAANRGETYSPIFSFIGFILAWVFWLLFFISLSATFINEETIVTPDSQTYTISDNDYASYNMFLGLNNLLAWLCSILTVLEVIFLFNKFSDIKEPLKPVRNRNVLR